MTHKLKKLGSSFDLFVMHASLSLAPSPSLLRILGILAFLTFLTFLAFLTLLCLLCLFSSLSQVRH